MPSPTGVSTGSGIPTVVSLLLMYSCHCCFIPAFPPIVVAIESLLSLPSLMLFSYPNVSNVPGVPAVAGFPTACWLPCCCWRTSLLNFLLLLLPCSAVVLKFKHFKLTDFDYLTSLFLLLDHPNIDYLTIHLRKLSDYRLSD
jgi:hypothetical protein